MSRKSAKVQLLRLCWQLSSRRLAKGQTTQNTEITKTIFNERICKLARLNKRGIGTNRKKCKFESSRWMCHCWADPRTRLMRLTTFLGLALLLPQLDCRSANVAVANSSTTNATAVPDGWMQLPSRELVLDVRHEPLDYSARQDAVEFVAAVLNVLLGANYTVRLSDKFVQSEIKYYRENLNQEKPPEISKAVLSCLEKARASGVLDWECFKGDFARTWEPKAVERHLPWLAPPIKARAVMFAGTNVANFACLRLSLKWTGRDYGGGVQHTRRPGGLMGETVITEGDSKLWAFEAVMRLTKGGQSAFEKTYPREEWQTTYITVYERPVWKTSQAILQDLASGLRSKPGPVGEPPKTKSHKHT